MELVLSIAALVLSVASLAVSVAVARAAYSVARSVDVLATAVCNKSVDGGCVDGMGGANPMNHTEVQR